MLDIEVLKDPAAAEASLDPIRTGILRELVDPGSVPQLAVKVELPRQKLPTFAIDGEITFRSAAERAAFAEELGVAVAGLVEKYHDGGRGISGPRASAGGRRRQRLVVALHPALKTPRTTAQAKEPDND
jgi:hypothetical protein